MDYLKISGRCLLAAALGAFPAAASQKESGLPNGRSDPSLSPDGNQVAFVWNGETADNHDIYVAKLCSWPVVSCKGRPDAPLRLTTNSAPDFSPAWSPDGRHVAFCRKTKKGADVLLVPAPGGAERKVGESAADLPRLAWSGDGKSLAIVDTASPKDRAAIFLLSIESGAKQRLTTAPADTLGDSSPALSPDGRSLAFVRTPKSGPAEIYLQALADGGTPTGEPQRLNLTLEAAHQNLAMNGLCWTADGSSLILASGGLWKIPVSGGAAARLAEAEGEITTVSVAREGRRVVYGELLPEVEIWRTAGPASKPSDFPPIRLVGSPDDVGSPNISRDSKKIAFGSFMSGSWEVWKCDHNGANPTQLSFLGDVPTGSYRWSPDGKYVVFDGKAEDGLLNDIYIVAGDGGTARRLTKEPSVDIRPCFSADQRWVYFTSNRSGTFQIWKVPVEGGAAVQVTRNGGYVAFESLDGKYLYYGKGRGQTTLWRVPSGGGEEVQELDNVNPSNFNICDLGIVILNLEATPRPVMEFYSFATRKRTELPVLPKEGKVIGSGTSISVAPDGRWMVYHQEGRIGSGIRAREY